MDILKGILGAFRRVSKRKEEGVPKYVVLSQDELIAKSERVISDISNGTHVMDSIEELGNIAALSHDVAANKALPLFQSLLSSGLDCEDIIVDQLTKIGMAHEGLAREQIVPPMIKMFEDENVSREDFYGIDSKVVVSLRDIGVKHPDIAKNQIVPSMINWIEDAAKLDPYAKLDPDAKITTQILEALNDLGDEELDNDMIIPAFKRYIDDAIENETKFSAGDVLMLNGFIAGKVLSGISLSDFEVIEHCEDFLKNGHRSDVFDRLVDIGCKAENDYVMRLYILPLIEKAIEKNLLDIEFDLLANNLCRLAKAHDDVTEDVVGILLNSARLLENISHNGAAYSRCDIAGALADISQDNPDLAQGIYNSLSDMVALAHVNMDEFDAHLDKIKNISIAHATQEFVNSQDNDPAPSVEP